MKKILYLIIVGAGIFFAATSVSADSFKYYLDYEFTGGTDPAGDPPWLTAEIRDDGVDDGTNFNKVRITMSTDGLIGGTEFVGAWYFNWDFDDTKTWAGFPIEEGTTGPSIYGVTVEDNGYNVGGPGGVTFDIFFDFPESNAPFKDRFGPGETVVYQFIGDGLMASDFDVKDTTGSYFTAAHVQGIALPDPSEEGSGKIGATAAIPEPGTILLLGTGLAGLLGIRRFKFKK